MHINIISRTTGVGLDRSVALVKACLESASYKVTVSHSRGRSLLGRALGTKKVFDLNIFVERVFPNWYETASFNILIPNQERFPHRHIKRLRKMDAVFTKTRHATEIFSELGSKTHYIGFTSFDLLEDSIQPDYQSFVHLAGRSTLKGTEKILQLWKKHPEWPRLTLIQCKENAPSSVPENVKLLAAYLSAEEIKNHLNANGIHLCTSLSEGWGHYIVEAMSCRGVVICTDGPPMNELIQQGRGIPVPYEKSEPRHLGVNFHVDIDKLENTINQLLLMASDKKKEIGSRAREWFLENDAQFQKRLPEVLTKTLAQLS